MKIGTKIEFEDTSEFSFYTCIVCFNSEEAKESLTEYMVDDSQGYEAERCSDGDPIEIGEVFSSPKSEWDNKKSFMKETRKEIKLWKDLHRGKK